MYGIPTQIIDAIKILYTKASATVLSPDGEKNSRFAHFAQKLSKIGHFGPKCPKMEVFRFFLGIPSLLFSETLHLIRAFNSKKMFQMLF